MKRRTGYMVAVLLSCASGGALGGVWDYRIGKFVSDAAEGGLTGPVRAVEENTYVKGTLTGTTRTTYDAQGSMTRWVYFAYDWKGCGVHTYDYDTRGFLVGHSSQTGTLAGPNDCQNLRPEPKRSYTNGANSQGTMTAQRWLDPAGKVVWEYTFRYDGTGRLAAAAGKSPSGDHWSESYTYASDARGTRIIRKHSSRVMGVTNDATSTVIVSPQGRILEIRNVPEVAILGGGRQTFTYLPGGQLTEHKLFDTGLQDRTHTFSNHDSHGNWTVGTIGDTRVERSIRY